MGIMIFALAIVLIIEIGMNFVTIEKATADYTIDHKLEHKKTTEIISIAEKNNIYKLRSWY
jgi:hypothetical protein